MSMTTWPYWPRPPVWRTKRPCTPWTGVSDRLAVGDLRPADVRVHPELAHQPVDDDLEVQLAHAGDDRLAGLLVRAHAEGRDPPRTGAGGPVASLSWSAFVFGSTATSMTGSGKSIDSSTTGLSGIAQRVAGRRLLEADGGRDRAGADLLQVLAVVRVHLEQAADALLAAGRRVHHVGARVELAGVDAEVGQLADERVAHDLERERREGLVEVGRADRLLAGARVDADDRGHVDGRRQVVDDGLEQRLHALVLERRAEQHGRDRVVERRLADGGAQLVGLDRLVLEERDHDVVVVVGDRLDEVVAVGLGLLAQLRRDLALLPLLAERVDVADRPHGQRGRRGRCRRPRPRSGSAPAPPARPAGRPSSRRRRRSRRRCGPSC